MTTKKITKKDLFNEVIKLAQENGRNDIVEFAQHEIDLLNSKKSSNTMTATQKENENIKTIILEELARVGKAVTITDFLSASAKVNALVNGSNQKTSALMKQLVDNKQVTKIIDKKKSYFTIAN
jgi:hypothetical protein